MSLFELPIEDYKDFEVVPEGEYDLQIYSTDDTAAQTGRPMITCQIQILNAPADIVNPGMIFHRVLGIMETDPPGTVNAMLGNGKSFAQVFGLSAGQLRSPMEWSGATGHCLVIIEQNPSGVNQNALKLPRPKK